jgi:fumarate reductase subunit C
MTTKRKPYVRPMPSTWWKKLPFYRFYMLREGTAVPTVWFSIVLIYGLFALKHGAESWAGISVSCKTRCGDPEPDHACSRAAAYQNLV